MVIWCGVSSLSFFLLGQNQLASDQVSEEVLRSFAVASNLRRKVLISVMVRFKQSPRGLAAAMAASVGEAAAIQHNCRSRGGKAEQYEHEKKNMRAS